MSGISIPESVAALPPLRETIRRHGLQARKGLGQHFLLDLNLTRRIARAAGDIASGTVIEIGPGPGGLTRALLIEGAARVIAVERDRRCIDALVPLVESARGRLQVVEGDALKLDTASLGAPPRRIVANLPYNLSVPLLVGWLEHAEPPQSMTLMFQKEVADRITAGPGSPAYGRLAVLANWRCRTRRLFEVPADAFTPRPKVTSAVVELLPFAAPPHPCDLKELETVVAAAFGQRRKMLRRALAGLGGNTETLLAAAGIDPTSRAETVSIAQFAALARAWAKRD
ncbi:MAG: 16S rRNA (adenine(1518)-N(6)/adenine(1519)-N(6))-dimethyltransferase RsmA [Rhodospirillales bacterium]|nr:MAG: 16S rRNA (adenine(1518)-N(6)/adenine(1519)-N(6))-dimethyltransferase RsmA [Rhodospirillales bacterium]